uniref:Delta-aminolevulinic acid dehydratase n=1 Tax=Timspurckia oligopyrenoides TaxID=708627 RepID=A0A7S0ZEF1_9RHOD|mmetsp:Transcript_203/g.347  ORF Transcript_203/g.347 Transcript_203/m.347 type:complete len:412 (+) Transcript_203:123-1358(+)
MMECFVGAFNGVQVQRKNASFGVGAISKRWFGTTSSSISPVKMTVSSDSAVGERKFAKEQVSTLRVNENGGIWVPQRARPRRNRKSSGLRDMCAENIVTPANFIYPLFVHTKDYNEEIPSMPDCLRHSVESAMKEIGEARSLGVKSVIVFPKIPDELKTNSADECYNPNGLVPRIIEEIKHKYPDMNVWTDVALDPYSDQGHDGMVSQDSSGEDGKYGRVMNDETIEQLCRQAVCQARAGADVVAPSDMMDGRVGAIRDALDSHGFTNVSIVSYTAKYASAYYGPFRDALDSAPRETSLAPRNKKTYQMNPANSREALTEAALDIAEGADMLMVKPGLPYLDIVRLLRENTHLPVSVYHVSGEYAMMKAAAQKGWLDEKETVLETMLCFKRAGADAILTYYAKQAAQWMNE